MIKVYEANEILFENNGIKTLHPLLAEVHKADNDDYYVELRDIIDNMEYYQKDNIVRVPTPWGIQGFRCDNPKVNNNRVECKAWHLSYDAKLYIVKDSYSVDKNCNDALDHFNNATDRPSPFTTISDITTTLSTRMVRKTLFEIYSELINEDKYGGHWYRDNFILGIKSRVGEDRGIVLAQNKNITDMQISENWDDVCTKVLPYTTDGEVAIELDEEFVELEEDLYDITYAKTVKFENELKKEDYETEEEFLAATKTWLRAQADNYLQANKLPKINYSVAASIDNVSDVGDIIYIKHNKCKVNILTEVISVVYDAIRGKYKKIEFGNFKKGIKNLSQEITAEANKHTDTVVKENRVVLEDELKEATSRINSVLGNSYVVNETGSEIIIVDRLPKETAIHCLRFNSAGIGFSNTGFYGPYNSCWTIDGTLNMQHINVINLVADMIKGGTLKLGATANQSGVFELYDESNRLIARMDKSGIEMYALNGDLVKLNPIVGFAGYNSLGTKCYWADGDKFHMRKSEVEEEITLANKAKWLGVDNGVNVGIGLAPVS